jgi:ankyrin repeat protein
MTSQVNRLPRLAQAIEHGDAKQFHRLLEDSNQADRPMGPDGWPPLCCAAANRKQEMIAALLAFKVNPNHPIEQGMAAGMVALAFCKDVPIAKMLLRAGAHLDIVDKHGRTPLDWAIRMERKEMIALFTAVASGP